MPVLISCQCGKQLRVPDEYAGRRVKCPVCGQPTSVPNGTAATAPPQTAAYQPPAPPPAPPGLPTATAPAGMIRFTCGACGKQMQAKAEFAGRSTRCPGCQSAVLIADPQNETIDARANVRVGPPAVPPPAPADHLNYGREDDYSPRRRSRRKKHGGSALPWILGGVML